MKHTSGWEPTPATKNRPPSYVSPFGRSYTSEHQDWEPPHLPPALLTGGKQPSPRLDGVLPDNALNGFPGEPFPEAPYTLPEPPGLEPPTSHVIHEDDIPPDDFGWGVLLGRPVTLPPVPSKDRELALT
jgi:hypothetical protein